MVGALLFLSQMGKWPHPVFRIAQLLSGRAGTQTFVLSLSDGKAPSFSVCLPDSAGLPEQTRVSSLLFSFLARGYFCK